MKNQLQQQYGYAYGQITEEFIKPHIKSSIKYVYVCGPPPMMEAVEKQLKNLNVDEEHIIKEEFQL